MIILYHVLRHYLVLCVPYLSGSFQLLCDTNAVIILFS